MFVHEERHPLPKMFARGLKQSVCVGPLLEKNFDESAWNIVGELEKKIRTLQALVRRMLREIAGVCRVGVRVAFWIPNKM